MKKLIAESEGSRTTLDQKILVSELRGANIFLTLITDINLSGGLSSKGSVINLLGDVLIYEDNNDLVFEYKTDNSFWNKRFNEEGFEKIASVMFDGQEKALEDFKKSKNQQKEQTIVQANSLAGSSNSSLARDSSETRNVSSNSAKPKTDEKIIISPNIQPSLKDN